MFTPLVQILAYLSSTFLLGLVLGWLLWKFGGSKQIESVATELQYWKQRLAQARLETDQKQDKIDSLEREKDNLKKRLAS